MKKWLAQIVTFVGVAFIGQAAYAICWNEAAAKYGVDPLLLKAIGWQESRGKPNAVGIELPDGNRALGLMQINTIHLPELSRFGIKREHLFDACTSIDVAGWVLSDCINRFGSTWKAVGCYYAGPASKNVTAQEQYVASVQQHYAGYLRQQQQAQQAMQDQRPSSTGADRAGE